LAILRPSLTAVKVYAMATNATGSVDMRSKAAYIVHRYLKG